MSATPTQLESVLAAARDLLGARQDGMLTIEEWAALARAVAACTGRRAADYLTDRDLERFDLDPPPTGDDGALQAGQPG